FVKTGWWNGTGVEQVNNSTSGTVASPALGFMSSNLDMAGYAITTIGALSGINSIWSIDVDGNFVTRGTIATSVQTDNGDVKVYASGSKDPEITISGSGQLVDGVAVIEF